MICWCVFVCVSSLFWVSISLNYFYVVVTHPGNLWWRMGKKCNQGQHQQQEQYMVGGAKCPAAKCHHHPSFRRPEGHMTSQFKSGLLTQCQSLEGNRVFVGFLLWGFKMASLKKNMKCSSFPNSKAKSWQVTVRRVLSASPSPDNFLHKTAVQQNQTVTQTKRE